MAYAVVEKRHVWLETRILMRSVVRGLSLGSDPFAQLGRGNRDQSICGEEKGQ
jgi:hypothetical protein